MPLIFADACTFTKNKSIPCLPKDVIGIELPLLEGRKLINMSEGETVSHFKRFKPKDFIIFDKNSYPRYSTFHCKVDVEDMEFKPLELTPDVQTTLFDIVRKSKKEVSGTIKSGRIQNMKEGTPVWAPLQPDRTLTSIPFHTHPADTLKKFKVNYGLPSREDLGYINPPPEGTINAHLLVSTEGIYVISKKTCTPPLVKKGMSKKEFSKTLDDCSFLLLPWCFENSWFIF